MSLNRTEALLESYLREIEIPFVTQGRAAGHRCDALSILDPTARLIRTDAPIGPLERPLAIAWEANGEWWHSKPGIVLCDELKVIRLVRARVLPVAFWSETLKTRYDWTIAAMDQAYEFRNLTFWHWKVDPKRLPSDVTDWMEARGCTFS